MGEPAGAGLCQAAPKATIIKWTPSDEPESGAWEAFKADNSSCLPRMAWEYARALLREECRFGSVHLDERPTAAPGGGSFPPASALKVGPSVGLLSRT